MHKRVAIIGGGPAGCSAALKCSQLGLRVVLFEANKRYRDKPCGDALTASAVNSAYSFGLTDEDFRQLGGYRFNRIEIRRTGSSSALFVPYVGGWVIPRSAFDQALRDVVARTCEVRYNSFVRKLSPHNSGLSLQSAVSIEHFEAVILATGASSKLSQFLGIDGEPNRGLGFRTYIPQTDSQDALLFNLETSYNLQYSWAFPMQGRVNIGACNLHADIQGSSPTAIAGLRTLAQNTTCSRLAGGIEPLWSGKPGCWHHPWGVVSCGDCAGLVNPVTGEGITAAFMSGEMAALAIAKYLDNQRKSALEYFSEELGRLFAAKYLSESKKVGTLVSLLESSHTTSTNQDLLPMDRPQ